MFLHVMEMQKKTTGTVPYQALRDCASLMVVFAYFSFMDLLILSRADRVVQVWEQMLSASLAPRLSQHYLPFQDFEKSLPVNRISE